jgi:hypothetical protein
MYNPSRTIAELYRFRTVNRWKHTYIRKKILRFLEVGFRPRLMPIAHTYYINNEIFPIQIYIYSSNEN